MAKHNKTPAPAQALQGDGTVTETPAAIVEQAIAANTEQAAPVATEVASDLKIPRSIVPAKFKERYSGSQNTNGDPIALALKAATTKLNEEGRAALDLDKLHEIADANGVPVRGANNGQFRMNVANRLRGLIKHGKQVKIAGVVFGPELASQLGWKPEPAPEQAAAN